MKTEMKDNSSSKEKKITYSGFLLVSIAELEASLSAAESREEAIFYRTLINLKLQLAQERIVGETLL